MIIFLYGKDTYRLQQKLKEIEQRYKKTHQSALNLEKIDAIEFEFREFWDKLRQTSMFIKKKLFFLENIFKSQVFKENFLKKIKEIADSQDIAVVIDKGGALKTDKLFPALKKYGKSQEFKQLQPRQLFSWAKKEFERQGAKIEEPALATLIDFVGNDLWLLSNGIKKLSCFKAGSTGEITRKDIELLVKPKIETAIFETIDAIGQRNKKRALTLLQKHLEKGDSPFYLLSMINFQFRNLLIVKSRYQYTNGIPMMRISDLSRELVMHPFVLKKTMQQMARFSLAELKKIYHKIFEADLNMKTGKIAAEEGLKMLIAQI